MSRISIPRSEAWELCGVMVPSSRHPAHVARVKKKIRLKIARATDPTAPIEIDVDIVEFEAFAELYERMEDGWKRTPSS